MVENAAGTLGHADAPAPVGLLTTAPVGFAFVDREYRFLQINPWLAAINGRSVEEHLGRSLSEVSPALAATVEPIVRRVLETGTPVLDLPGGGPGSPPGGPRHRQASYYPVHAGDGQVLGVGIVVTAITDRQRGEVERERLLRDLVAERERLEAVLRQLPTGVLIAEAPSGKLLLGNEQVTQIWRQSLHISNALEEYTQYQAFHADGRPLRPEEWPLARSIATGEVVRDEAIDFLRGDGTRGTMEVRSAPIRDSAGEIIAGVATFHDITERLAAEAALRISERRYRTLIEQSPLSIQVFTPDGSCIHANAAWEQLWGTSRDALTGYNILDDQQLAAKGVMPAIRRGFAGEVVTIPPVRYDPVEIGRPGLPRWVEAFLYPMHDEDGKVREVVLILEDVSARERAVQSLRFLAEASQVLATSLEEEELLASIARLAVPTLADYCMIDLVAEGERAPTGEEEAARPAMRPPVIAHADPAKESLVHELRRRYPPEANPRAPTLPVWQTGQAALFPDVTGEMLATGARDAGHLRLFRALGPRSSIIVPLTERGRTIGTLTLVTAESGRRYDTDDLALAEELARRATVALDNARLYREAREAQEQLARQVVRAQALAEASRAFAGASLALPTILETVARLVVTSLGDACILRLVSDDGQWLHQQVVDHADAEKRAFLQDLITAESHRVEEGLAGCVVESGEPLVLPRVDQEWLRAAIKPEYQAFLDRVGLYSILIVPLRMRGRIIGTLFASRDRPGCPYTTDDLVFLQDLTDRAAQTIDNARLYAGEQEARQAAERAAARTARLQDLTAALAGTLTPTEVATVIIEQGVAALGAHAGSMTLLAPNGEDLEVVSAIGYSQEMLEAWRRFPLSTPAPLAEAVRTNTPILLDSYAAIIERYPRLASPLRATGSEATASVPLAVKGRTLGALGLSFAEARTFSTEDRDFMLALARQCAQALERARLYEAEHAAREQAEHAAAQAARLQAVTGALAEAATREAVAEAALREGMVAVGAVAGGLGVLVESGRGLERLAMLGYPPEIVEATRYRPLDELGPIATTARTGEALWLESNEQLFSRYPQLATIPERRRFGATVAVPLTVGGQIIGVMSLRFAEERPFDAAARDLILAIAGQCAQALERARLYEAERAARERLAFLAEASTALAASLDYQTTLTRLVHLVIPYLADWCSVNLLEEDGTIARLALAHVDPAKEALMHEIRQHYLPGPESDHPLVQVLNTSQPVLFHEVPDTLLQSMAQDQAHLELERRLAPVSVMIVPLVANGRAFGAMTLGSDRAERRFGPEDLALADDLARRAALAVDNARLYRDAQEAIAARDQFLSIASHELRTPVAGIRGYAQLLRRQLSRDQLTTERLERGLYTIDDGTARLERLTQDLLDVSRLRLGQLALRLQPLDLARLVEEVTTRYQDQLDPEQRLIVTIESAPCPVNADADRLEQVLANLLENAGKYSPDGGMIEITLARDDAGVLLAVRDQGIGLSSESLETIFQPFGRAPNAAARQIPGLGLGLYICRDIIQRHGGRLWAESAGEGQGMTAKLWLPADVADLEKGVTDG